MSIFWVDDQSQWMRLLVRMRIGAGRSTKDAKLGLVTIDLQSESPINRFG
jgi:hypothetical protein